MTRSERWAEGAGWTLLAAAAGLRALGAWGARAVTDMDSSVVALMAHHMVEGTDWPVFFYGQGYMGSLEPMGSALLMKLFGNNGFMLAMGPAVFAVAALWALWRWAKAASGPWGGVAALLLGAVGPAVYFSFQFAARGGYMVSLCVDALALWGAAGLAADWWEGRGGGAWKVAALGLLAGVGLWTDPIVAPALGAAMLVLLLGMRGRFWKHWGAVAAGVAGTVAGASPWWLWWLRHGGNAMALPAGARSPLRVALKLTWERYLAFQGGGLPRGLCTGLALAGLALAAAGVAAWLAAARRREARSNFATLGAVLFAGAFLAAFVLSGFNQAHTGRYWIPAWPALALLGGWACAGWGPGRGGRVARFAAWGLAGALAAAQAVVSAQGLALSLARAPGELERFAELGEDVAATGADALLAPRQMYPLNYAWRERIPVSDGLLSFYAPNLTAAELAEHPAYFADWKGAAALFERMGLECRRTANGRVFHGVESPPQWRVEAHALGAVPEAGVAELRLDPPRPVSRVAFAFHGMEILNGVPRQADVDVLEGGEWRRVHEAADGLPAVTWSGTRAYLDGGGYQEIPVESECAEAVRLRVDGKLKTRLKRVDLLVYGTEAVAPDCAGDGDAAVRTVLDLAGNDAVVFAPRWLANRLHRSGELPDIRNRGLSPRVFNLPLPAERPVYPAGTPVVVAVESRYAGLVREAFGRAGVVAAETVNGDPAWTFFRADPAEPRAALRWNDRWFAVGG